MKKVAIDEELVLKLIKNNLLLEAVAILAPETMNNLFNEVELAISTYSTLDQLAREATDELKLPEVKRGIDK